MFIDSRRGFTLIELSIVLVIIGLIVGGILLGQDLINAATIRAQISQLEKYSTSVNTFRIKYGYLPGDMPITRSTRLGFFATDVPPGGTFQYQDGNNLVQGNTVGAREPLIFWRHLTDAQMIDGNYSTATSGNPLNPVNAQTTNTANAGTIKQVLPPAKIGRGNFVGVYGGLFVSAVLTINGVGGVTMTDSITPIEAHEIDSKMDDGVAITGKLLGFEFWDGACTGSSEHYDLSSTNANTPGCSILFLAM